MEAHIHTGKLVGVKGSARHILVETGEGLLSMRVEGMPEGAARELRTRIKGAMQESDLGWPEEPVHITMVDSPNPLTSYDLPVALGVLTCMRRIPAEEAWMDLWAVGELGLSGDVRAVRGILPLLLGAKRAGAKTALVPRGNLLEASLVPGINVYGVGHLREAVAFLSGKGGATVAPGSPRPNFATRPAGTIFGEMREMRGLREALRALEIAAVGGHHLLLKGPPGSGKVALARCLPTILPELIPEEMLEVTAIYSAAGLLPKEGLVATRPFRAPHHTISDVAMLGGGRGLRPGEASLAHHGVLCLDELPEFRRRTLEALSRPMVAGSVWVQTSARQISLPTRTLVVGTMLNCPCGHSGSLTRTCACRPDRIQRYQDRAKALFGGSRIIMQASCSQIPALELAQLPPSESSASVRSRVQAARKTRRGHLDDLDVKPLERIARSIAALEGCTRVEEHHREEARQYVITI